MNVANPRKTAKPSMSVAVITNTPDASAGSTPSRRSAIGTRAPALVGHDDRSKQGHARHQAKHQTPLP